MGRVRVIFLIFIAAGLYFAAFNVDAPLLYVLTSLVLSFLVVAWFASQRSLRKIACKRIFPKYQVFENQLVNLTYELKSNSNLSHYAISLIDSIQHQSNVKYQNNFNGWIAQLPKKKIQNLTFSYRFPQRGRYIFGPLTIRSNYPFDLFYKRRKLQNQESLRVFPEIIPLTDIPPLRGYFEFLSMESRLFIGQGDEFYGIREYRFGDPLRHIHWKGTARHRELMVREVQRIAEPIMALCMDSNQYTQAGTGKDSTFEYSVKICASLAFYAENHRYPLEFRTQSSPIFNSFLETMDYLSECQANSEIPLQNILWEMVNEQRPFTTLFVFFSGTQEEILQPLKLAYEKHINIVIIWLQKESFSLKVSSPVDSNFTKSLYELIPYIYEIHKGDSIATVLQSTTFETLNIGL